jgi:hypothetical protein
MTINAAFAARTTNGTSTGYVTASTMATVEVQKDSVFNGAVVIVECCSADTDAKYAPIDSGEAYIRYAGVRTVTVSTGMYLRLRLGDAAAGTSINANIIT